MTTVSSTISAVSVQNALRDLKVFQSLHANTPNGAYLLSWSKTPTSTEKALFDAAGDFFELFTFPPNTRLISASVVVPELDGHATPTITLDLMAGDTVLVNDSTAGQAGGTVAYTATGVVNVSSTVLKLKIEDAAATVPSSYSAFTAEVLVYVGAPKSVSG